MARLTPATHQRSPLQGDEVMEMLARIEISERKL
jgi:hypothetical protein